MNAPNPSNWQTSLRGAAATVFLVALGLYVAVALIKAVADALIAFTFFAAVVYGIICFERYRRSRW